MCVYIFTPAGTGKTLMARQIGKMLHARDPKIVNGPGETPWVHLGTPGHRAQHLCAVHCIVPEAPGVAREYGISRVYFFCSFYLRSTPLPRGGSRGGSCGGMLWCSSRSKQKTNKSIKQKQGLSFTGVGEVRYHVMR